MASADIQDIPNPPITDRNWMTDWLNWKKLKAIVSISAGTIAMKYGVLQRFSIADNLTIPAGWYSQMVAPVIEAGVTVTIEAGGLWFIDA